jgi:hypothetical protein
MDGVPGIRWPPAPFLTNILIHWNVLKPRAAAFPFLATSPPESRRWSPSSLRVRCGAERLLAFNFVAPKPDHFAVARPGDTLTRPVPRPTVRCRGRAETAVIRQIKPSASSLPPTRPGPHWRAHHVGRTSLGSGDAFDVIGSTLRLIAGYA